MPSDDSVDTSLVLDDNAECCHKVNGLALYRYWLKAKQRADKKNDSDFVKDSLQSSFQDSPSYQEDSERNGAVQPMVITRKDSQKADALAMPGDNLYIGDMVKALGEMWICVDSYIDEFGVTHAELWICNYLLRFQNGTPEIIERYVAIDDGSYSKPGEEKIPVVDDSYTIYISLDEDTKWLFVDKRLAIGKWIDQDFRDILEVCKISWIDLRTRNRGVGSHILVVRVVGELFNPDRDNYTERICDYLSGDSSSESPDNPAVPSEKRIEIAGKQSIRIGTKRTYEAIFVGGEPTEEQLSSLEWRSSGVAFDNIFSESKRDGSITLQIPLDDTVIGKNFVLQCIDTTGEYESGSLTVEVSDLG